MTLREALDLCSDSQAGHWVEIPGNRPATAMVAGVFDAGMTESSMRTLDGNSIAVYEPDARLSMVWQVPDEPEAEQSDRYERGTPEWAEQDDLEWKNARGGWVVILLNGAPIWQESVWYLDWGSGVGGYVPYFRARYGDRDEGGIPTIEGWETSAWAVGLAGLLNTFSPTAGDFANLDPTTRVVPSPSPIHPVEASRNRYY